MTQGEDKQKEREQGSSNEMPVSTMDHINITEKDEKEGRQHHEENGGKNKDKGMVVLPRIIRNHIKDHEEIQGEYSNEASQHHQEVTSKAQKSQQKQMCEGVYP